MPNFIVDIPLPSMGATVSELTIIHLVVAPGAVVAKGQKLADLESDKSAFEFESPAAGTILEVRGQPGQVKRSGETLFRMETADQSLQHLAAAAVPAPAETAPAPAAPAGVARPLVWTPRALKLAQGAGLDPATLTGMEATGPGGRVSGDDVLRYLAGRK